MTILDQLRQSGTSKSGCRWVLYKTESHGWAVKDTNHFEWRAVRLIDENGEIHDKEKAIKFLEDNGIKWHEE